MPGGGGGGGKDPRNAQGGDLEITPIWHCKWSWPFYGHISEQATGDTGNCLKFCQLYRFGCTPLSLSLASTFIAMMVMRVLYSQRYQSFGEILRKAHYKVGGLLDQNKSGTKTMAPFL